MSSTQGSVRGGAVCDSPDRFAAQFRPLVSSILARLPSRVLADDLAHPKQERVDGVAAQRGGHARSGCVPASSTDSITVASKSRFVGAFGLVKPQRPVRHPGLKRFALFEGSR